MGDLVGMHVAMENSDMDLVVMGKPGIGTHGGSCKMLGRYISDQLLFSGVTWTPRSCG